MFIDWLPAISSTSLLAVGLWLSRGLISERLKNSVKHDYDKKIETLLTELRKNEEIFKSEIKEKESQIEALRSGALSGIVDRQSALYQRKLSAVEQLWSAVISLSHAKYISNLMTTIDFDVAAEEAVHNPKVREMFSMLDGGMNIESMSTKEASVSRPFLSPLVWAFFSAYQSIVINAVMKLQALKNGIDKGIINTDYVTKLVKTALPEYESYIEKYGSTGYHFLLDTLETKILEELDKMLKGEELDQESIEKASQILKEAERVMESNNAIDDVDVRQ